MFKKIKNITIFSLLLVTVCCLVVEPAMALINSEHNIEEEHCESCCEVNCHELALKPQNYSLFALVPSKKIVQNLFFYIPDVPPSLILKPPTVFS